MGRTERYGRAGKGEGGLVEVGFQEVRGDRLDQEKYHTRQRRGERDGEEGQGELGRRTRRRDGKQSVGQPERALSGRYPRDREEEDG